MIILSITYFIAWLSFFFFSVKKITKKYHVTPPLENVAGLCR